LRRWCFEPFTRRVTEAYVNAAYCRMVGRPVEEVLVRIARGELPDRLSRLDHVCCFIDNLHASLREEQTQYMRWQARPTPTPPTIALLRNPLLEKPRLGPSPSDSSPLPF
jgi:hypothetical protein